MSTIASLLREQSSRFETATLIKDLGRLDLPVISVSTTLVALLNRA
jgi:hypothetical protein